MSGVWSGSVSCIGSVVTCDGGGGADMMQGEGVGGHPHYGHHVPMDLHVPQHFPYYAG